MPAGGHLSHDESGIIRQLDANLYLSCFSCIHLLRVFSLFEFPYPSRSVPQIL